MRELSFLSSASTMMRMTPSKRDKTVYVCSMGQKRGCVQVLRALKTRPASGPQGPLTKPKELVECSLTQRVISGAETHVCQPSDRRR